MPTVQTRRTAYLGPTFIALLRAFAATLREVFASTGYGLSAHLAELQRDQEIDDADEAALRCKYAHAIFQRNDLERRAAEHGVWFGPQAQAHHRAAILDFLDDPTQPTNLNFKHSTWFMGRNAAGRSDASMTHPVNQAAFQIAYGDHRRRGCPSDWYTAERAGWGPADWQHHEANERRRFETVMVPQIERHRSKPHPTP